MAALARENVTGWLTDRSAAQRADFGQFSGPSVNTYLQEMSNQNDHLYTSGSLF